MSRRSPRRTRSALVGAIAIAGICFAGCGDSSLTVSDEELRDAEVLTAERVTALHPELTWGAYCADGGADRHFPHCETTFVAPTGADVERITAIVSETSEAALGWNRDGSLGDVYLRRTGPGVKAGDGTLRTLPLECANPPADASAPEFDAFAVADPPTVAEFLIALKAASCKIAPTDRASGEIYRPVPGDTP